MDIVRRVCTMDSSNLLHGVTKPLLAYIKPVFKVYTLAESKQQESVDKLFNEPFEPTWMRWNRRIEDEAIKAADNAEWRDAAAKSRASIMLRHISPKPPPTSTEIPNQWPYVTLTIGRRRRVRPLTE